MPHKLTDEVAAGQQKLLEKESGKRGERKEKERERGREGERGGESAAADADAL